ncbi:MAG: hypothetical protein JWR70_431, partial [Modestobacter sp.]|nr:hypothetical protein [Modestobacter sp.]
VRNSGNAQCPACTLTEAITRSLNTTFYGLAYEVGAEKVRSTAVAATGLPETWSSGVLDGSRTLADAQTGEVGGDIGIGRYEMRPVDQAVGFATFANGGTRHDAHFVAQVADSSGAVLSRNDGSAGAKQVVPADVANDVTFALEGVAKYSKRPLAGNRPVASKTGTQGLNDTDNSDAWMVGYTPSISAAVWMGSDSTNQPIVNAQGRIIYGSGLPGAIWQQFMDNALAGTPQEGLPSKAIIKGDTGRSVPEPTTAAPAPTTSRAPATTTRAAPTTTQPTQTAETTTPTTTPPTTTSSSPTTGQGRGGGGRTGQPIVPGQPGNTNAGPNG